MVAEQWQKSRVCLVNPPHPYLKQPTAQAPLGLMYVAAALRNAGVEVTIHDLSGYGYDDDFHLPDADLYGLTGTVIDRLPVTAVAKQVKAQNGGKVVVGGPISLVHDQLDPECIDSVVIGEGEESILHVLQDMPNLQRVYQAERIQDIDGIAFPARDLITDQGGNVFAFNRNYRDGGSAVIITSRGCPFSCSFCASPGIWKRRVTYRSVENVMAEVDEIIETYGITQLRFSDDTFTLRRDRLIGLCDGLEARNVVWRASIRTSPNDPEMFERMYRAGCREVSFGVESGDDDVLSKMCKGPTVADNRKAIQNAKAAGLVVRVLFMIGTPGETTKTVDRNINFLADLDFDTVALTTFIPIPGSDIADRPDAHGCQILYHNIDHYNFYLWGPDGENPWGDLISLDNLTLEQLRDNRERMKEFIIASGRSNRG